MSGAQGQITTEEVQVVVLPPCRHLVLVPVTARGCRLDVEPSLRDRRLALSMTRFWEWRAACRSVGADEEDMTVRQAACASRDPMVTRAAGAKMVAATAMAQTEARMRRIARECVIVECHMGDMYSVSRAKQGAGARRLFRRPLAKRAA